MRIRAIRTKKITAFREDSLFSILDTYLKSFPENSVLVITSKIVSLLEGNVIERKDTIIGNDIMEQESDYYLEGEKSQYGIPLTIIDSVFLARAGIDSLNTNGYYVLAPKDSFKTSRKIRSYLIKRFGVKNAGVIIVDSHSNPLRRGAMGVAMGWSGFIGMREYKNTTDVFGKSLVTHANIVDALSAAAVAEMGEGNEQTPLGIITGLKTVEFKESSPTKKEKDIFMPPLEEDLFAPLFDFSKMKRGKRKRS